ncbi:MAG: thiamine phosphate synthase [Opitutae bacterium]|jgi:thiamine-phosphate pyrophosphorylase|nr:thiamine phosphate synthase [Opitutae bacterium]MBT5717541.1 thiamine phosphate synthase [Opitutae bacterium]
MNELPSIILISPPTKKAGEIELLIKFFETGLQRFHLRKPDSSEEELNEYLNQIPQQYLSRIVVHRAPQLLNKFPLAGYHHTSTESICDVQGTCSRSLHKFSELKNLNENLDYVFFGPVYHSISKKGYSPKISLNEIFAFFKSGRLNKFDNPPKVFALGGIRKKKIKRLSEVGFDGVALLGCIWGSRDPLKALNEFLQMDITFMLNKRDRA